MKCKHCSSERILELSAKCSDCCGYTIAGFSAVGYVPTGLGIGGGDYVEFNLCLNCGMIQGKFPLPISDYEKDLSDEEVAEFYDNYFSEGQRIAFHHTRIWDLRREARELSPRFAEWFEMFLNENSGSPTNYSTGNDAPSTNRFVQMYRSGDYYL